MWNWITNPVRKLDNQKMSVLMNDFVRENSDDYSKLIMAIIRLLWHDILEVFIGGGSGQI